MDEIHPALDAVGLSWLTHLCNTDCNSQGQGLWIGRLGWFPLSRRVTAKRVLLILEALEVTKLKNFTAQQWFVLNKSMKLSNLCFLKKTAVFRNSVLKILCSVKNKKIKLN